MEPTTTTHAAGDLHAVDRPEDPGPPPAPHRLRSLRRIRSLPDRFTVPVVGTLMVAALADEPGEGAVLAFLAFTCAAFLVSSPPAWGAFLPLMRAPLRVLMPILGVLALAVVDAITRLPGLAVFELLAVLLGTSATALVSYAAFTGSPHSEQPIRIAVIGSSRSAVDLSRELGLAGIPGFLVVGRIAVDSLMPGSEESEVPTLGSMGCLASVVEESDIDLLVMTGDAPRYQLFEEISTTCLHLPVRLWELSGFYEEVFGHVPVADINPAWFQYIIHPKYRAGAPLSKRTLDVVVGGLVLLAALPLLGVLALLIRRDGGPALFSQTRIGEGGRPLTIYKLRTMGLARPEGAEWASADDPRVTRAGHVLRGTHLDELPQLWNVIRGEMTLVGPRPEQPAFVDRLEEALPFYQRRHLVKPGITGWAQVRCGYAGSDIGSAWKLSHDLYYIKHRSVGFDLAILCETFRTLFADRRYAIDMNRVSFIHGYDPIAPVESVSAGASTS